MGTGQMLVTIFSMCLLGTIILNTNRGIASSSEVFSMTNYSLEDVSYATSIIQRAQKIDFDAQTRINIVTSPTQLTAAGSLGQETGVYSELDDVDDYQGTSAAGAGRLGVDTLATGIYYSRTQVHYVADNNLDAFSAAPTYHKRLDVWVWNKEELLNLNRPPRRGDTLHMATIISYWAF